jgi:hypothetical protein
MSNPLLGRQARRRLAVLRHVEEVTGKVVMTCRYFGISRERLGLRFGLQPSGLIARCRDSGVGSRNARRPLRSPVAEDRSAAGAGVREDTGAGP